MECLGMLTGPNNGPNQGTPIQQRTSPIVWMISLLFYSLLHLSKFETVWEAHHLWGSARVISPNGISSSNRPKKPNSTGCREMNQNDLDPSPPKRSTSLSSLSAPGRHDPPEGRSRLVHGSSNRQPLRPAHQRQQKAWIPTDLLEVPPCSTPSLERRYVANPKGMVSTKATRTSRTKAIFRFQNDLMILRTKGEATQSDPFALGGCLYR